MSAQTAITKTTFKDPITGRTFNIARPSLGGLERIGIRQAMAFAQLGASVGDLLEYIVGPLLITRTLLSEYLTDIVHPETGEGVEIIGGWVRKANEGAPKAKGLWQFESQNPGEFARLGEVVTAFHATFRETDTHFGALAGQAPERTPSVVGA